MESSYPRKKDEGCPQLLDLISKEREWLLKMKEDRCRVTSDEKKLELCLGPPGGDWTSKDVSKINSSGEDQSLLYFARFPNLTTSMTSNNNSNYSTTTTNTTSGTKRGFTDTVNGGNSECQTHPQKFSFSEDHVFSPSWSSSHYQGKSQQQPQQTRASSFLQLQSTSQSLPAAVMSKESSQHCCTKAVDLQSAEKKAFSPPSAANTAVPNSSAQKRTAPAAVVGWPPIRSFRKNLANSSSVLKPSPESSNKVVAPNEKPAESCCQKGMFVKINMDGVPIGRKVDLKAFNSYEKLSLSVDELFRGLLVAQGDTSGGIQKKREEGEKVITGLLDGSGEYTLVYEDNEGDRMLVGDVPWHMFVSTVKRLRVLKSSEISTLCRAGSKQGKISLKDG